MLVIPVIVPYWQSLGLSMKEIFELQAIYGLCLIGLDLPAGYFADLFGRKICLILSGLFNIVAFRFLYHGTHFNDFIWFEVAAALSYACYMGADVALLYDSSEDLKVDLLGKKVFYSQLGEASAALLSGVLAAVSLTLPAEVNLYTSVIPFLIALTLKEPEGKKLIHKGHLKNVTFILKSMFGHSKYLNSLIIFNIVYGLATYLAVWTYQSNWKDLGIPLSAFGLLWAGSNLAVALIAKYAKQIQKIFTPKKTILLIALLPIVAFIGMGVVRSTYGLLFMLLISFCRGLNSVVIQQEINHFVPSEIRASTNSFCSLGMRGSFVMIGPIIGGMIDHKGIPYALILIGLCFIVPFLISLAGVRIKKENILISILP
jgi:MFS family permease